MAKPLKSVASLITHPGQTFRRLTLTSPVFPAIIVLIGTIASFLLFLWSGHHSVYSTNPQAFLAIAPFHLLATIAGLVLFSAVWHFTADILGGAGRGITLQYFVVLSTLPFWLIGPLAALFRTLLQMNTLFLASLGFLALWSAFLLVVSMKELYRFSAGKAFANLILAPVCLVVIAAGLLYLLPPELHCPFNWS